VDAALWEVVLAVGFLEKEEDIFDGGIEELEFGEEVDAEDAGILEEPLLGFDGVFGVAVGIGDDVAENAAGAEDAVSEFDEGHIEVPFFPECLEKAGGFHAFALGEGFGIVGADIRGIGDDNVESAAGEDILEEEVPEEKRALRVSLKRAQSGGGGVERFDLGFEDCDGFEFAGGWFPSAGGFPFMLELGAKAVQAGDDGFALVGDGMGDVVVDAGVDFAEQSGFFPGVGGGKIAIDKRGDRLTAGGGPEFHLCLDGVEFEFRLLAAEDGDGNMACGHSGVEAGEVDAFEGFKEGIALHDFEIEIRERPGLLFIHDEGEPEAKAGDLDRTGIEIHAIDGILDDFAFGLGGVERPIERELDPEDFLQEADGKGTGADGGVADFDGIEDGLEGGGVLPNPVLGIVAVAGILEADEAADFLAVAEVRGEEPDEALLAHIVDGVFRGVESALVLVVLEQVFEDVAKHLGVDADLVLVGVVFVDGEVIGGEEVEKASEVDGGEVELRERARAILEEASVEVGNPGAGEVKEIARAVGTVEGVAEKFREAGRVKAVFVGAIGKEGLQEAGIAARPFAGT
jgi:hypothetical protein